MPTLLFVTIYISILIEVLIKSFLGRKKKYILDRNTVKLILTDETKPLVIYYNMKCKLCLIDKQVDEFYLVNKTKNYRDNTCKKCRKQNAKSYKEKHKEEYCAYYKQYRQKNKSKKIENDKEYYKDNSNKIKTRVSKYKELHNEEIKTWYAKYRYTSNGRYSIAKAQAKRKGKLFNLTKEEYALEINKPCYYCNNILGVQTKTSIGLDRLDNNRGYEKDNVVSCCNVCNTIKNQYLTDKETLAAVKLISLIRISNLENKNDVLQQILNLLGLEKCEIV